MNRLILFALLVATPACMAPPGVWQQPMDTGYGGYPYGYPQQPGGSPMAPAPAPHQGGYPPARGTEPPPAATPSNATGDYPLYSRDGGVVDAPAPGSVTESEPTHDMDTGGQGGAGGGRMYILELYQAAIDERDGLQLEVASLSATLQRQAQDIRRLEDLLAQSTGELTSARGERDRLQTETTELTDRLVTAQIRRLEAERSLLRTRIEWYRRTNEPLQSDAPASATPASATTPQAIPASGTTPATALPNGAPASSTGVDALGRPLVPPGGSR